VCLKKKWMISLSNLLRSVQHTYFLIFHLHCSTGSTTGGRMLPGGICQNAGERKLKGRRIRRQGKRTASSLFLQQQPFAWEAIARCGTLVQDCVQYHPTRFSLFTCFSTRLLSGRADPQGGAGLQDEALRGKIC
jgi:hypothetical protein